MNYSPSPSPSLTPAPHRPLRLVSALTLALIASSGCQRHDAAAPLAPPLAAATPARAVDSIRAGTYRGVLTLPGGELPFALELTGSAPSAAPTAGALPGDMPGGYLINGAERLPLTDVTIDGGHLEIKMPGYLNTLIADATPAGLKGEVVLDKLGGKSQHIPLEAFFDAHYRFFAAPASDNADISGRWTVTFTDDDGKSDVAVGEFGQAHDVVTGTVLTDTGDQRYLEGQVHGDEVYLSTFDGAHAYLYKAKVAADGSLAGDFWSGTAYHERFNAKRDANAALPDAYSLTALRAGTRRFDFAFPDLAGKTVTSRDPQFKGKVLIIALAGSWCPNCHDEAAFLEPLYREYRPKGLEVVSLMFEHFGDFERAAAATQRFRAHYAIDYTTLIAGISDKDDAAKKLPALERVYAFPTTILVDRKGLVRKIHTGFSGPATGAHYEQFVKEIRASLDQMLAEKS